jgi:hypothetical protein
VSRASRRQHVCAEDGCPELVPGGTERCPKHEAERNAAQDSRYKGRSADWRWVYDSPRWRALRRRVRREQPFCLCGCRSPWTDLDHTPPLRQILAEGGDPFARESVEGRCKRSHSEKTAKEVLGGRRPG